MSDNKPIVIENGILKESNTSGGGSIDITSSDPALTVSNPSPGQYVLGFDAELSKVPNMKKSFMAGSLISALKIVYSGADGRVYVADNEDTYSKSLALGVALNSAPANSPIDILIFGIMEDSSWNWLANDLIFLDTNGNITSTPPLVGFQTTIGKALSSNSILVNVKDPIQL